VARREEINIFHFSFLDILCNTIGALVFILMIFTMMTNNLVEEKNQAHQELKQEKDKIIASKKELEQLQKKSQNIKAQLADIKKEIELSKKELALAKTDIRKQKTQMSKKDQTITQLKKRVASMQEGSGLDLNLPAALMAEWGKAGGTSATQISGQRIAANSETILISKTDAGFSISGVLQSPLSQAQAERWIRAFDTKNQKIQILSDLSNDAWKKDVEKILQSPEKGSGLLSIPEVIFSSEIFTSHDMDKNGEADKIEVDRNKDSVPEEAYFNWDPETKRWKTKLCDMNGDGRMDTVYQDTYLENDSYEVKLSDFNPQNGKAYVKFEDTDRDGCYDIKRVNTDLQDEDWEEVYSDFNPETKTWKTVHFDTNNDGVIDVICKDKDLNNNTYEEKEVDSDTDGVFDALWKDLEPSDADWEAQYLDKDEKSEYWKEAYFDTNGDGLWDAHAINQNLSDETFEILMEDKDQDGKFESKSVWDPLKQEYILEK
jgi:hypothetical protein